MHTPNEWNDRFFLAAQDGQIIAVRNRDLQTPIKSRTHFTLRKPDPAKPADEKKDDMEKKIDDKKDDKKEEKKDGKKKYEKKKDDKKEEKKADKKDPEAEQALGRLDQMRTAPVVARWERREAPVADAPGSPCGHRLSAWLAS